MQQEQSNRSDLQFELAFPLSPNFLFFSFHYRRNYERDCRYIIKYNDINYGNKTGNAVTRKKRY